MCPDGSRCNNPANVSDHSLDLGGGSEGGNECSGTGSILQVLTEAANGPEWGVEKKAAWMSPRCCPEQLGVCVCVCGVVPFRSLRWERWGWERVWVRVVATDQEFGLDKCFFFFSFGKFVGQVNERQMDLSSEFRRGPRWKTPLEFISMRMASEAMKMDGLTQEVDIREKSRDGCHRCSH